MSIENLRAAGAVEERGSFTLDTSGLVDDPEGWGILEWSDLSPFAQGYVEALFESVVPVRDDGATVERCVWEVAGFRHLSPEAVEMILRDCELWEQTRAPCAIEADADDGRELWRHRQANESAYLFPPYRIFLSDEGKVCLEEVPRTS